MGDDTMEEARVIAAGPSAGVGLFVDQDARRITVPARNADVIEGDDGGVTGPLHLDGDRGDEVRLAVLNTRADQPRVGSEFRDGQDRVFVLLLGAELPVLDAAPASAECGAGE